MIQQPLFATAAPGWKPTPVSALPSWAGAKRIAVDTECCADGLRKLGPGAGWRANNYVVGVSFAIEDGPAFYLPFRHEGGDNLPEDHVLAYLRDQCAAYSGDLAGANIPFDLDYLAADGVTFPKVRWFRDVQIADPLVCELHDRYSLQAIAERHGLEGKNETGLRGAARDYHVDPKKDMWKLPGRFVAEYAIEDARLPLLLLRRIERQIDEQELWGVYDLESKLLPILSHLRRKGIRIHQDRLAMVDAWALAQETAALATVHRECGVRIAVGDVWKAEVVARALAAIGMKVGKTSNGKSNVDKAALGSVKHPVTQALDWARRVNKLRTTFVESVRAHMGTDGRLHTTYNQLKREKESEEDQTRGAAYGRLSSANPNLQQQPARDEFGPMWRSIYLPEEGCQWASCDYSQQEPRMAVHYASISRSAIGDEAWEASLIARDKYRNDPSTDNHQMMADMAGIKRKDAKEIFLGLAYGMGGAKMCAKLKLPTRMVVRGARGRVFDADSQEGKRAAEDGGKRYLAAGEEGQRLLDTFDEKVPFIKKMAKACEARAKKVGCIRTISGRRCHFPVDKDGNVDWAHKAFNRLIQGSSADQTKRALVDCFEAGLDILAQVHDEIAFSVESPEESARAAEIMRTGTPLELPSKVDTETGESWGHSMGWKGLPPR